MRKIVFSLLMLAGTVVYGQEAKLVTPWTEDMNPEAPLQEYPRPQLVRENWQNLNGQWDYTILPKGSIPEIGFAGSITVPFPVESYLSGVQKEVGPDMELWYEKEFELSSKPGKNRVILHFGAVDWESEVWVNGTSVGVHQGGFDGFSYDITDQIVSGKKQTIRVRVWDPSDGGPQPRGKQIQKPHGIWYTPVTGIWQTVWIEQVPQTYLASIYSNTDWENGVQVFYPEVEGATDGAEVEVSLSLDGVAAGSFKAQANKPAPVKLSTLQAWSPDNPVLYDVTVKLINGKKVLEEVDSYAAYRDVRMGKDADGFQRIFLNGNPLFQYGPLDQGWWPDGLYTAPTDEALLFDIVKTKEMGFNMIRKHVKVEPARWYYHADKEGMLVWQDMPSGDMGNRWEVRPGVYRHDMYKDRTKESEEIFKTEWKEIIREFKFFPSIVVWVPFNEAWGQFKTTEIVNLTRMEDDSRLINSASGGNFEMKSQDIVGDIMDLHNYPDPVMPDPSVFGANKIMVLGEFGGLGLPVENHTWQEKDNWGYQSFANKQELFARYSLLMEDLKKLIPMGLAAAVYTQTTDVEVEVNGMMTYDRQVYKFDFDALKKLHQELYR
ncbi:glycoside hydrolase family 2 protein [Algoriphagus zhangzhouensis]|uniref:Glycosyl hydrolases family 2 n=1 Tax=Algoriphagus zhangzhouensis TaxID=1073327 RepID=A0A1M7Z5P4_9BACT|nr:sugar-binding domain-containing protein [Algoriphagus zhangzhouensis]TDY48993.1 glycosyl hydrolase family 2 [Algoriphagus zhangzhouensis]SHO60268.1 Glycosyl hydrolases family 2 [Algoriphagus zhangzhouensis]